MHSNVIFIMKIAGSRQQYKIEMETVFLVMGINNYLNSLYKLT